MLKGSGKELEDDGVGELEGQMNDPNMTEWIGAVSVIRCTIVDISVGYLTSSCDDNL